MTEVNDTGVDRMLFMRVWRKDPIQGWRLVSSAQFRDPRLTPGITTPSETMRQISVPAGPTLTFAGDVQEIVRVGGDIKEPRKTNDVRPMYPQIARAAAVQGVVILEIVIDPRGDVSDARIIRSIPLLDQAALDAVKQWKFTPTLLNGAPVSVLMTVTVNFSLQ
jgi:TonB family protein